MKKAKCNVCGADETDRSAQQHVPAGATKWTDFECGAGTNDGPGTPCPHAKKDLEPVVTAPAKVAAPEPESIEKQVAEWSKTDVELRAAVEATKGITVDGYIDEKTGEKNPKKGREAVHSAMMTLSNKRFQIEHRRLALKAPVTALGKHIDAEAKRLTAIVATQEEELRIDRDKYDAEQQKIKDEADRKKKEDDERERKEKEAELQKRIDQVVGLGGQANLAALAVMPDDEYQALVDQLTAEKNDRDEKARLEKEAKEARDTLARARAKALVDVGAFADDEFLANASEAEFLERRDQAIADDKRRKDENARLQRERDELDRKQAELKRQQDDFATKQKADQEQRDKEARDEADKEAADARAAQLERERPEREQVLAWCDKVEHLIAFESPVVREQAVFSALAIHQKEIYSAVQRLKSAVHIEPAIQEEKVA